MDTNSLSIVLADDDDDDRQLFTEALAELPLASEVITFDNGVSLMDHLLNRSKSLPDIIFLDLNMPMMSGEECLRDIRNEEQFSGIPVVIYSTSLDLHEAEFLKQNGADKYLQKPTSFPKLKLALQRSIDAVRIPLNPEETQIPSDFIIQS